MELKNANSNGCNVVTKNLHSMFVLFFKYWKLLKIGLKIFKFQIYNDANSLRFDDFVL